MPPRRDIACDDVAVRVAYQVLPFSAQYASGMHNVVGASCF
jgi:hypothetical protein